MLTFLRSLGLSDPSPVISDAILTYASKPTPPSLDALCAALTSIMFKVKHVAAVDEDDDADVL